MKCFEFEQLAAYVDGVLSQEEIKHVEKHMEFCPSCREVVVALEKEDAFLQEAIQSPVLPSEFDNEVLSKLEPYQAKKKRWNWPNQLLTAASIVLAFGLGASFLSDIQQSDTGNSKTPVVQEEKDALYSIEDEGVLLEVTDVNASPLKIEIFYRLKPEESVLDDFLRKHNVNHLSQVGNDYKRLPPSGKIVDINGQELPQGEVALGSNGWLQNSVVIKPAKLDESPLPDTFQAQIKFDDLFMQEGEWELSIPIDVTEAKLLTKSNSNNIDFMYDDFNAGQIEWELSTNAHRLQFYAQYTQDKKDQLKKIMEARNDEELTPIIIPELSIVNSAGEELLVDGFNLGSHMGESFTFEYYFANRVNGMDVTENLSRSDALTLRLKGFRLEEPENTQFKLSDGMEQSDKNEWTIESVTVEENTTNSKLVSIIGKTTINNLESFIVEISSDKGWVTKEVINTTVSNEGTFIIQTNMPKSITNYQLDITNVTKWFEDEKEIILW
ncbi:anti-sigma factor family protein [Sutcliffiella horikoshii]|uniref:anti-sigma factor family protein n=1 Tax=Sutcliffiella horikoshii TaxID=79883 RepID=UPI001CFEB3AD|nr:zf-HC2 domain-containing protein [Sutcliffiella horikoshii]